MLGKWSNPINQADWYKLINKVVHAINNSVHSSTLKTPSTILFVVDQKGPIVDGIYEYLDDKLNKDKNIDLKDISDKANLKIVESQKRNKIIKTAKQKAPSEYSVEDFVTIRNIDVTPGTCKKFAPKYRGSYKINRVFDNDRFEVTDIDNCKLTQLPYKGILEAARLKPWLQI